MVVVFPVAIAERERVRVERAEDDRGLGLVGGDPGYNDGNAGVGGGFVLKAEGGRFGATLVLLPRIPDSTPLTLGLQLKVRFGR